MPEPTLPFLPTASSHKASPNAPALFDDSSTEWLSYGMLRAKLEELRPLFPHDVKRLIFCCVPRTVDGVTAYLAAAASGHAVAMADIAMPHFKEVLATYRPYWIIAPAGQIFNGYKNINWDLENVQLFRKETPDIPTIHPDLYLLLLTSGSTGSGKGVRLSYKSLTSNTEAIPASLGLTSETRALAHLPLSYSFGLSILHTQLAIGGSCVLTEYGMMSQQFWQLARTQKATLFSGVPYHYEMLSKLGLNRVDVPTLKIFLQAGGKMGDELTRVIWQQIEATQGQLFIMYGQTEASPRISCLPLHKHPDKLGSCGQALSGGQLAIEEEEIIYTGPNVMMGYAETLADLALGDVTHGRLATGDTGHLDAEGYLTIYGRKQRFAKLFGQRVSLDDLEKIASMHAPVVAVELEDKVVLVSTHQDPILRERLKATVLAETGLPPTWLDVRGIGAIPHTPNGKVDYIKLRGML